MSRQALNVGWYRRASRANQWLEQHGVKRVPLVRSAARVLRRRLFSAGAESAQSIISTHGIRLELPGRYVRHYVERDYEPVTTRLFLEAIRPGAVVVDIGAHIGYYTCLAAHTTGPAGRVHAIEPAAENLTVLRRNVALNELANVEVHGVAAAASAGERTFVLTNASDSHGFYDHPLAQTVDTVVVQTRAVDDLVPGRADLIKLDAEGAELEVLDGLRGLLARSTGAVLIVEWNPRCLVAAGRGPEELPAMLREIGLSEISVLDDYWEQNVRSLDSAEESSAVSQRPSNWYVNLYGRV